MRELPDKAFKKGARVRQALKLGGVRLFRATALLFLMATACSSIDRLPPVSSAQAPQVNILNIHDARVYARDAPRIGEIARQAYERRNRNRPAGAPTYFLVNSGGGDDGAFGAGLLAGWSEHGGRPEFDVVTGVSTGALSAPFAFLGRDYDPQLKEIYTNTAADQVFERRTIFAAVADDAMTSSTPLREMISRYVDDDFIARIAAEYQKGRLLFIMTTNLDQGRPVIWNIGAIASSQNPEARKLIVDVLLASASIPAIFPPVMIDITFDGQKYQEMHVDGGTVAQAFLYPPSFSLRRAAQAKPRSVNLPANRKRVAYIIRNGRFVRSDVNVKLQTIAIAKEALATMTTSSGVNDTYRMFLTARRDGVDFNLASIGDDFDVPYRGPFDKGYMQSLFYYGYQQGRTGYRWQTTPPGYAN